MAEIAPYKGGFVVVVSPTQLRDIMQDQARHAWYHQRHIERWERRYSKPYPHPVMKVGVFRGMSFIADRPLPDTLDAP